MVKIIKDTGWQISSESSLATDYVRTVYFNFKPTVDELEGLLESSGATERKQIRKVGRCTYRLTGTAVKPQVKQSRTCRE